MGDLLEVYPPAELNHTRRSLAGDPPEVGTGQVGNGSTQIPTIERIEEVSPQLRRDFLADMEAFDCADVFLGGSEPAYVWQIHAKVTQSQRLGYGKGVPVQVEVPLLSGKPV